MLAIVLGLTVNLALAGQGGSRGPTRAQGTIVGDRTDDRYWTWGIFYFNRDDPAFLVETRFGVGYTFNLGHPLSWLAIAALVGLPLLGRLL